MSGAHPRVRVEHISEAAGVSSIEYHTVNNPHDPVAVAATAIRREQYQMWRRFADDINGDLDTDAVYAPIVRSTGESAWMVEHNLFALCTLDELPGLRSLVEKLHHLDMKRLRAIEAALTLADRGYFAELDTRITTFLSPTRANQPLPSAKAINKRIRAMINELDASLSTGQEDPELPQLTYYIEHNADGTADLSARMDAATAVVVDKRVRALAAARGIGFAEAHALLVTGADEGVKVNVNLYRAHDVAAAPMYMPRAGWLNPRQAEDWEAKAHDVRDMDDTYDKVSAAYATPRDMEACVEGFDSECIFPTCSTPAEFCDNDHVLNHDDGGPTTARNLRKLCRTHHNLKTVGHLRYIICPVTGNAIFLLADGTWAENRSDGPLTPENRSWVQTFRQRRDARQERARQEALERRRRSDEAVDAADQCRDAARGGQEEGEDACPWAADLLAQTDTEPQPDSHADNADRPHEPVGVRE